jgi:hypothetical protein
LLLLHIPGLQHYRWYSELSLHQQPQSASWISLCSEHVVVLAAQQLLMVISTGAAINKTKLKPKNELQNGEQASI